jgi:V/A-type H+/Na+-transporting ATPase subunit F
MELAVIGKSEFTLGFRLSGIKKVVDIKKEEEVIKMLNDGGLGIVITDQETFDGLNDNLKEDVINSIKPVFVVVSARPQEELRKIIIRSIGVDLLKN